MERKQELEWETAQRTGISVDLVSAAKQHLDFLAAVDRNRWLYEGPGLDRAIYRYNAFWLPLLAKQSGSQLVDGPLVVPLDCEWIWHCHRLNPVRYISDCKEFYGKILDNRNVVSSVGETSRKESENIWKSLYPSEPYELDLTGTIQVKIGGEKFTKYDLISAVQRQTPFFYQVSRPHMNDNRYLQESVARYKGFLHLIKTNKERSIKSFSVPTYDIDLIWHTHQLHPVSYCKDLVKIMGKVLEHDDTDSDRTKGQKLDVGFSGTEKTYEAMYGCRYRRAGAMYLGQAPSPVRTIPYYGIVSKKLPPSDENQKIKLPEMKILEVMLEFTGVRNLPEGHDGNLFLEFGKAEPDAIFNAKKSVELFSEFGEKQVVSFHCQPTGHLLFEIISKSSKTMGAASISMEDFVSPHCSLTVEKWLELVPSSNTIDSKAIGLRVAVSVTVPTTAPYVLRMIRSRLFPKSSCLFPLPMRKVQFAKSRTDVVDEAGNLIMSLQTRVSKKSKGKIGSMRREVVGTTESGERCKLAVFAESKWSIVNSPWSLKLPNKNNDDGHFLELTGPHTVRLFHGGRLDYESKYCQKHRSENELERCVITAIEFSEENPYGRAVALLDLKSGIVKVKEEWFLLPGFMLAFILGSISRKEGYISNTMGLETLKHKGLSNEVEEVCVEAKVGGNWNGKCGGGGGECEKLESGGCGGCGGCGGGCGNMVEAGGCGGCGGGCGNMAKTGGCGGCGGGCGGGGCGNMAKTGGCGGCGGCGGGGGCGNMARSGGCGGCGGCGGGYDNEHPNQAVKPGNEVLVA
ncbi:hypothetical protein ABFS82_12G024600 [Erythranthe guttata]|uniref:Glycine-rich domain-containing protein-like n=1 Tax=Erythranthe guttata TaxID=4155 RepID=A0A022RMQ1_ERYGU|nr:PREDICTED: glycine-rich domain-containing protein 1-like [Erythranthe guttata]EYU41349.1 hypothetical protein MIMGU_mgv1a001553mg [Erythranthe guttata]|eukprot:XP_012832607.1 PREDICTED: glycine-rich domain-containing protein 1-like [Erythranthe guttata]